jgi:putative transposase
MVSYEIVHRWVNHFGPKMAADLRKRPLWPQAARHVGEVYLKIDDRLSMASMDSKVEVRNVSALLAPSKTTSQQPLARRS